MKFGIEIELVGMTQAETAAALNAAGINTLDAGYTHRVMPQWKVVSDSSVTNTARCGCEVVSPPMELNADSLAQVAHVCQVLNDHGADVNKDCGLHVHIEVANETPQTIATLFNRYKKFETQIDGFMPLSRRGSRNGYCRSLANETDRTFTEHSQIARSSVFRMMKVNLQAFAKYKTIEFRQHSGTINASKITKWVKFLSQFVIASRDASVQTTVPSLSQDQIIRRLPVKKFRLFNLLRSTPMNSRQLSDAMGYNSTSRTNTVLRQLRALGLQIVVKPSGNLEYVDQSEATAALETADSLFRGIDEAIRVYYVRRSGLLA